MNSCGVRIAQFGGPEVLEWAELSLDRARTGESLIRHTAIGLNFIDVYHRTGLYTLPLPLVPGVEAAGIAETVGAGIHDLRVGDRVAYGADRGDLLSATAELFGLVEQGAMEVALHQRFPLKHVRKAHETLETRKTTGSTILVP